MLELGKIMDSIQLISKKYVLIWVPLGNKFNCKAAYDMINEGVISTNKLCEVIWKCKVPESVKLFLWKVHSHIVPTKVWLAD